MLEYDNSAFYYFTLSLITIYLVPVSIGTLQQLFRAIFPGKDALLVPRTKDEELKVSKLKKEKVGLGVLFGKWTFLLKLASLVAGWFCFWYLLSTMGEGAEIARFDPYAILGVEVGMEDRDIKKAYRTLSLKYHPDKNPGNKMAEDMFMKIAKAYEALTDATARENWEKYGNPDGKQPMEVSIALPTFLLDKDYHNQILILYLIAMVVVIPSIVAMWYARSKKYGEKNVMYDSYAWYNHMLSENAHTKGMAEVLAGSAEFRALNRRSEEDQKEIARLFRTLSKDEGIMPKMRYDHPIIHKGCVLLFAHVTGKTLSPELKKNLDAMLIKTPDLVEAMIELACSRRWLETTQCVIDFSQHVTQALWVKDNPLRQLPHIEDAEVKAILGGKGNAKGLTHYLKQEPPERKGTSKMSEEQVAEMQKACEILPDIDVEVEAYVEDEEEIAENDLVTIKVTLTRNNVPEGGRVRPVYAPRYPVPREEGWWVLVGNKSNQTIFCFERITDPGRVVSKEVRMMAPSKAGTVKLDVYVKSDCYLGLDQHRAIEFKVVSSATLPAYEPHPDDLELDNEPTLFEQVMQAYDEDTDSDDEAARVDKEGKSNNNGDEKYDDESDDDEEDDDDESEESD